MLARPLPLTARADAGSAERACAVLRAWILEGRLAPGAPLRQDELAARLGMSKIPVREALVQLRGEGLVTGLPNRGAFVSRFDAAEAEEVFTIRVELESLALARAIPALTPADLINAESVLALMDAGASPTEWSGLNWEFHATLYQAARMPRLLEILRTLHLSSARYLVLYLAALDYQTQSQGEHHDLLAACRDGRTDEALALLRAHVEGAREHLLRFLATHPGDEPATGGPAPTQPEEIPT